MMSPTGFWTQSWFFSTARARGSMFLSTRYLKKDLSILLQTWHRFPKWTSDELIRFWKSYNHQTTRSLRPHQDHTYDPKYGSTVDLWKSVFKHLADSVMTSSIFCCFQYPNSLRFHSLIVLPPLHEVNAHPQGSAAALRHIHINNFLCDVTCPPNTDEVTSEVTGSLQTYC